MKLDCLSFLDRGSGGLVKRYCNVHAVVFYCDWDLVVFSRRAWNRLVNQNIALVVHAGHVRKKPVVCKLACLVAFAVDKYPVQHGERRVVHALQPVIEPAALQQIRAALFGYFF